MLRYMLALCGGFSASLLAATYELPPEGSSLVGRTQYHQVQSGDTIADIAKQYDVGFLTLMAANKGIDPFLPAKDYVLTIPTRIILPDVPRDGIVINLAELRLYYFQPTKNQVDIFPVGIGRVGRDTPEMVTSISQKRVNPTWTPPKSIRKEYREKGITLPAVVPSGPDNPLGDYAMRLAYGIGEYLIHGTNKEFGIGLRVSAGCIRMDPEDIDWLFPRVKRGEKVRVINQPVKVALEPDRSVFLEAHEPLTRSDGSQIDLEIPQALKWWLDEFNFSDSKARAAILAENGVPIEVVSPDLTVSSAVD
ncbi:L,D-transpeptidase family protein [Vibrio ostreicida]|uniref:L,D-transpeptidase family protein n=1 Tax=Vibrio ostreicida TaxID=526588 RepID=A0ABT8C150_9VIBR|nr:L,D-transpeptidase family protein [Vibrio ostreicida]MDN3612085.1 L,D-transpeptidase family protein [Vibrio ostreicida]NPD08746.1 L,D-transpeptidase family protein [Vibrio ostreicida]